LVFATALSFGLAACVELSEISQAADDGKVEKVKTLLKADPRLVFDKDKYDTTPLHYAANREVAEALLAAGADVNARNKYGDTPLHFAATRGRKEVVQFLLEKGAEVNVKNRPIGIGADGETPLDCAVKEGKQDVADLLRQHGGQE
jgi:ankyrin repeat protein